MGKLKFALIGCGRISHKHVEALKADSRAELVAVCDPIKDRAFQYGLPAYKDYHTMLSEMEDIDAVSICTPSYLHAAHVIDVASAYQKHIICEKPMALTTDDCDMMIDVCKANNSRLFIVKQNRFNLPVQQLLKAVNAEMFGKMVLGTVRVRWMRKQEYYDLADWRNTDGVLINQAAHHIDLLLHIMGNVVDVQAMTATRLVNIHAEDTAAAVLRFESGALGIIEATTATRPADLEGSISILGEKGTVEVGGFALNQLKTWAFSGNTPKTGETHIESLRIASTDENPPNVYGYSHTRYISHVIDCLISGKNGIVEGTEARRTVELIQRIYEKTNNIQRNESREERQVRSFCLNP